MKKGKMIIGFFAIVWACILVYVTFILNNSFISGALLFFGAMLTVCGFAYGCEMIEKVKNNK